MAGKIFINYRRGDDSGFAQALFWRLEQAFTAEQLFMDVDNIDPGLDFVRVLEEQVAQCDVLISVIGQNWIGARDEAGARRLDNPDDFVRVEIEAALAQNKRVIPVLVGQAPMPRADELPEPIKPLARRNAVRLSHERFRADTDALIAALQRALKIVEETRAAQRQVEIKRQHTEGETTRHAEGDARQKPTEEERNVEAEQRILRALDGQRATQAAAPAVLPTGPVLMDSAERRLVTVAFCDMVGSTELSARMELEEFRQVIAAYHKCAAAAVQRFGGFVAQYLGDGVLVFFGYPQAHEDDAERAVRASLEVVAAVSALKTHVPLQARVGIATGLVVVSEQIPDSGSQERSIVGNASNLAARLQGVAEPNMVVIAESTRRHLGSLFELQDLGARELKGFPEPLRAWAVLGTSLLTNRFEALRAAGLGAFVGREHELEVLERGFADSHSQLCVIDLAGEPGMGKSRLVHEFRQRIGNDRAFVLSGSCSPDGRQTPFLPLIEVVRSSFQVSAGEAERDVTQKLAIGLSALGLHSDRNLSLLLHLLGLEAPEGGLAGLDGVLIGLRTRELLQQLLEARCRLSTVIMVIEDLHWIDSVSEEVLGKVIDSDGKIRLLLLTTSRPEYRFPWLDRAVVRRLHLEPLPAADIRRLVQARLGVEALPEALARQVTEKAEGNPLFAEEIVSYLTERGMIQTTANKLEFDANVVAATLPASVQSLLTERVDRLAPKDRALFQAAAVIGRRFDAQLLAKTTNDPDVDARLAALQNFDLIRRDDKSGDYFFKHALVRDALYQSLLNKARAALHARIAGEIERRSSNRLTEVAEVLAHHYSQTDYSSKAFGYLVMAGSKSLSVYSLEEAATHFAGGLALLDKNPECATEDQIADFLVSYTLSLNMALRVSAIIDVVGRYLARLERMGDDPRAVLVRHQYAFALLWNTRGRDAIALQRETSRIAERLGDSRSRAYSLASEIHISTLAEPASFHDFEILRRKAVEAASDTNDAYIQNWTRFVIGWEEIHRGLMNDARESARELMQVGGLLSDPRSTGFGLALLTWISLISDSLTEAVQYSDQSLAVAITPFDRGLALDGKGCALVQLRQTEEGAKLLEEHQRRCIADGYFYALAGTEGMIALSKVFQGHIRAGINLIQQGITQLEKIGYRDGADWYRGALAEIYLAIIGGNEKLPFFSLLKNLPIILNVRITAVSRIRTIVSAARQNPHLHPTGHHMGRAEMTLGLLYKIKKKRALALKHLTEARQILSQFGQTPILARVDAALAELGR